MANSQLPEKGMKVPIRIPAPSRFWLEQNLHFFFFFCQKQEAVFCSQKWRTVARNDVKLDKMLQGQDDDFCRLEMGNLGLR